MDKRMSLLPTSQKASKKKKKTSSSQKKVSEQKKKTPSSQKKVSEQKKKTPSSQKKVSEQKKKVATSDKKDDLILKVIDKLITKKEPKKEAPKRNIPRGYKMFKAPSTQKNPFEKSIIEKPKLIKLTAPKKTNLDDIELDEKEKDDLETYVDLIKGDKRNVENSSKEEFAQSLNDYEKELKDISTHIKDTYNPAKSKKMINYLADKANINLRGDDLFY